ncbi:MAG TPA: hypothetical protein VGC16_01050 [Rhizomicrobium sp.]
MKPVFFASIVLLLATAPAFAGDYMIVSDTEAQEPPTIELTDLTGGVGTADVHDGGGNTVVIQMIQPAGQSAAAAATSARYAGAASSH